MPRFFISPSAVTDSGDKAKQIVIVGDDAKHITKSLRMSPGEILTVCDGNMTEYTCRLDAAGEQVLLSVTEEKRSDAEPPYSAVLYQAVVKGDKFDTVVQKAVECGVSRIVPMLTERCVARPDAKAAAKKAERWQKIAYEAAKQCGRGIIPAVMPMISFDEAIEQGARADAALFCYENERELSLPRALRNRPAPKTVALFIGSEGGFSPRETELAAGHGLTAVSLGKRILRTETASSFVLACLACMLEL